MNRRAARHPKPRAVTLAVALLAAVLLVPYGPGPVAASQDSTWTPGPERYGITVTRDIPITLDDGTILRADIHAPADPLTGQPAPGRFPVIVGLTPYGKRASGENGEPGFGGLNPYLIKRGYLGVVVDVPGTGGSQGRSQLFGPDEAAASVQVIDWAAGLPSSTGRVGLLGHSYLAIDQLFAAAAVGPGSPLKAIFPMSAANDPYRDLFVSGGVMNMESSLGLIGAYAGTRTVNPLVERPSDPVDAANLTLQHGTQTVAFEGTTLLDVLQDGPRRFDGPYWQERAPDRVLERIVRNDVAVYLVGGLYDVFQRGAPLNYAGLQNAAAGRPVHAPMTPGQPVSGKFQLTFGPWTHDDIGAGAGLSALQLRWFDHWLKGVDTGITDTTTPLHVIEPGGARYDTANYPVDNGGARRLHLRGDGSLHAEAGAATEQPGALAFTGLSGPCGRAFDQWAAGAWSGAFHDAGLPAPCSDTSAPPPPGAVTRDYTGEPLAEPLRLGGPIGVTLHATATTADSVFVVTLSDVAPDGTVTELSGGAVLGSQRQLDPERSWRGTGSGYLLPYQRLTQESRRPVVPGEVTRYDVEVRPVFATVPAGHRLRITIGTGEVPHLAPPPATWPDLIGGMYEIQHASAAPSWVELPVVRAG